MHKLILLLFLLLPTLSFGQNTTQDRATTYSDLATEIATILNRTKVVGVSVAIIEDYKVVWASGFGVKEIGTSDSVTTETLFQAASITKSVIALTIMKEYQDGKLALDSNVNTYLTDWKLPDTHNAIITLEQLLSHTAGVSATPFPAYSTDEAIPTCMEALSGKSPARNGPVTLANAPGQFLYSAGGYAVLQQVLEDVEQRSLENIVQEKVFTPLAMRSSTFSYNLPSEKFHSIASGHLKDNALIKGRYFILQPLSFGSLWTTAGDLARFLIDVQLSLAGRPHNILNQENAKRMLKPRPNWKGSYGLGFSTEVRGTGMKFFGHDGHNYGYICSMLGSIEGGRGLVVMTNSENGWKAVNQIKKLVGRKLWGF